MNQIGQSLLPIAPAPPDAATPNIGGKEASDGRESFDSLLDQSSGHATHVQILPVDEPVEATTEPDPADALAQAGLISVLQSTAISPASPPEPMVESDFTDSKLVADETAVESVVPTHESKAETSARAEGTKISPPLEPAARRIAFAPLPAPTPQPQPVATHSQPPPEPIAKAVPDEPQPQEPSSATEPEPVPASVSGIALPIQAAPVASIEIAAITTPAVTIQPTAPAVSIRPIVHERVNAPAVAPAPSPRAQEITNVRAAAPAIAPVPSPRAQEIANVIEAISAAPESETQPVFQAQPEISATPAAKTILQPTPPAANAVQAPSPTLASAPVTRNPEAEKFTGMTAAKPSDAMPAPTIQRSPRSTRATSAEPIVAEAAPTVRTIGSSQTLRAEPVAASQSGRERSPNEQEENKSQSSFPEITPTGIPQPGMTMTRPAASTGTDAGTPIRAADVVQVIERTAGATAQLRASGQERMEIAVRLDSGHELTIQLQMANGQVTPIIRTESEPLRLALEQNWSQFSQRGGDREVLLTTPIFESPQTSSNMSDLNQQRDGRQRAYHDAAPDYFFPQSLRRNTPLIPQPSPAPAPAPAAGVRLYA